MARRKKASSGCSCMYCGIGASMCAIMVLIFGAIIYFGYGWGMAIMAMGILMLLATLMKK